MRESVEMDGFAHTNPVPVASRIGNLVFSGVLTGHDPETREMPDTLAAQCANAFDRIRELLAAVGGTPDNIGKITVYLANFRDRKALNDQWLRMFPNPDSRPARQVIAATLDGGALIHCDVIAVLD